MRAAPAAPSCRRTPQHDLSMPTGLPQIDHPLVAAAGPRAGPTAQRLDVRAVDQNVDLVQNGTNHGPPLGLAPQRLVPVPAVAQDVRAPLRAQRPDQREEPLRLLERLAPKDAHAV